MEHHHHKEGDHDNWNNEMAKRYNPNSFITQSGILIRWVEEKRLSLTKKCLGLDSTSSVLDVGCGAGNLLERISGRRLVGLDLSDYLLEQARTRLKNRKEIEVVKGNAEQLPFADNTFNRVVCSEVLEHISHPDQVISEIHRVAQPNAKAVITIPNENLIHLTKKIVLALGLKKFISGRYVMSDNMLDEWHVNDLSQQWVLKAFQGRFVMEHKHLIPFFPLDYHRLFVFRVTK